MPDYYSQEIAGNTATTDFYSKEIATPQTQAVSPIDNIDFTSSPVQAPDQNSNNPQNASQLSPADKALEIAGQFGKGVYANPLAHPILRFLSSLSPTIGLKDTAEQTYANLRTPQGIMENVAYGAGAVVPLLAATTPIMKGVNLALDGLAGGSSTIPVIGKLTSFLKNSDIAKAGITGYAYGQAEAQAANAQGSQIDAHEYAKNSAMQFMLWGGLTRLGATFGAKMLPKDLPAASKIVSAMPDALKKAYTPEGLGSIAGGMIAGSMNAPDNQQGIAGAIIGGALSALNPSEQFQFKQGMGKALGFNGVSAITDHWGKNFAEANDVIQQNGYDAVEKAGTQSVQVQNNLGGNDILATPQIVYIKNQEALGDIKKDKSALFDKALQENENINPKGINSFLSLLRQRVSEIKDPTSPVVRNFNKIYDAMQGFMTTYSTTENLGETGKQVPEKDALFRESEIRKLPLKLQEQVRAEQARLSELRGDNNTTIGLNALHQIKMEMEDMVSPRTWAGEQAFSPDERLASGIAKQISTYIGRNNPSYAKAAQEWRTYKEIEGKVYSLDPTKLSQNMLSFDEVHRNIRENDLGQIAQYFKNNGKIDSDSRGLLKKYYAYQTYNNPSEAGLAKNYPVRAILSALVGGAVQSSGLPGGFLLGGLAGWHMGNPQAWLPVLKGASIASLISKSKSSTSTLPIMYTPSQPSGKK